LKQFEDARMAVERMLRTRWRDKFSHLEPSQGPSYSTRILSIVPALRVEIIRQVVKAENNSIVNPVLSMAVFIHAGVGIEGCAMIV